MLINAAFNRIKHLEQLFGDSIPWSAIEQGFEIGGEKVWLANRARGIFKPKQLERGLVSIKTISPRKGRVNIYTDQELDEGFFRYSLQRGDPHAGGNKHLWEALEDKSPFIYFHAVAEGVYKAIWPCFVSAIYPDKSYCEIVASQVSRLSTISDVDYALPTDIERRYTVRESKVRLHQAMFREAVLSAYSYRCAISNLPVVRLLEAAHITPDSNESGSASVTNGIALSKIHHNAYDSNLLGISPDYEVVVGEQLLSSKDGKLLEAIVESHGKKLVLPKKLDALPDRDRLAIRYRQFLGNG